MLILRRRTAALLPALTLALSGLAVVLAPAAQAAPPANDNLSSAATLTAGTTVTVNTAEATVEEGESMQCDDMLNTVWFSWTAPRTQDVAVETFADPSRTVETDTVIAAYTGSGFPLTSVTCDDQGSPNGNLSKMTFNATAGTTYRIQLGTYMFFGSEEDGPGLVQLRLTTPSNDDLAGAKKVQSSSALLVDPATSTKQSGEVGQAGCGTFVNSLWYAVKPDQSGDLTVATSSVGVNRDTVVQVWTGPATNPTLGGLSAVACNDDTSPSNLFSSVTTPVTAGTTYYVQVSNWSVNNLGSFRTDFTLPGPAAPPNDNIGSALALTDGVTLQANTAGASLQFQETGGPNGSCGAIRNSVWYQWVATGTGTATVTTSGGAASYDSVLGVWKSPTATFPLSDPVNCNDQNGNSNLAVVGFRAEAATTYWIQLANSTLGRGGDPGPGAVDIRLDFVPSPAGDDLVEANLVELGETQLDNTNATAEDDETFQPACEVRKSIWYAYTATADGGLIASTSETATNRDTVLAVWTDPNTFPSYETLTEVGCNDDIVNLSNYRSTVEFAAAQGTTYYFQVGTYADNGAGPITFSLDPYVPSATTTEVSAAVTGRKVDLTATVTPFDAGDPLSGSVEFFDGATSLGTTDLSLVDGTATTSIDPEAPGHHEYTAVFTSNDYHEAGSTSEAESVDIVVDTTTALEGSATGRTENFTATVTGPSGTTPVGTVQFVQGTDTVLDEVALTPGGTATYSRNDVPLGQRTYHAVFVPTTGSGYTTSTSSDVDVTVSEQTALTLDGSASGTTVTLDATQATAAGSQFAQGTIEFFEGSTSKGTQALNSVGKAQLVLTGVPPGTHTYHAVFTPQAGSGYQAATSADRSVAVASPPPAKAASTTKITAPKQVKPGKAPRITITVKRGTAPAAGKVTVAIGKLKFTTTVTLSANGTVKVKLPKLTKKVKVVVTYTGNTTTLASTAKAVIKIKKPT